MFRISLRELLILVAVAALCIVSLKYASHTWSSLVTTAAMLLVFAAVIVAVANSGSRQKFALAFAILAAGYHFVVDTVGGEVSGLSPAPGFSEPQVNPEGVLLPTSQLLQFLWLRIQFSEWLDPFTGKSLGKVVPGQPPPPVPAGPGFGPNVNSHPRYDTFMRIGHLWWALLLGYVGGRVASFVYQRRTDSTKE
jgi:hypothetical protein